MLRPSSSRRASELARPPDRIAPCALNVHELHGPMLTSCWPPNRPGTSTTSALYVPAVGIEFRVSFDSTICRDAFCTSTTGVSPVTVTVSSTAPTRISVFRLVVTKLVSSTPSRFVVLKPTSVNETEYVPGRRFSIRYWPALSVTAERVFSIRAGLAASTVTPGSTAPDVSLTTPASDACANSTRGMSRPIANRSATREHTRTWDLRQAWSVIASRLGYPLQVCSVNARYVVREDGTMSVQGHVSPPAPGQIDAGGIFHARS